MARRLAGRYGYPEQPHHFDVTLHPERLEEPLRWRKPRMVFVCSMSDLFHKDVPPSYISTIVNIIRRAKTHTFQILTKRPRRMLELTNWLTDREGWPSNVWLGVTAENQAAADERIPLLLQIPAAVRFVSCEPLLGAVDLQGSALYGGWLTDYDKYETSGRYPCYAHGLDWVIVGGESGPGARPMHPDWARSLRDQAQAAGVPFHFKQWGAWSELEDLRYQRQSCWLDIRGKTNSTYSAMMHKPIKLHCLGKKAAGRLLDGREWNEMPEAE